jgi:hypothetical protein
MKNLRNALLNPLTGMLWLCGGPALVGSHYVAVRCIGYASLATLCAVTAGALLIMLWTFVEACRGRRPWNNPIMGETEAERHGL